MFAKARRAVMKLAEGSTTEPGPDAQTFRFGPPLLLDSFLGSLVQHKYAKGVLFGFFTVHCVHR
jgi:hypothetical protein